MFRASRTEGHIRVGLWKCDECVIIAAEYSKKDIISDTNYDTEKTYGINDEFEYFIKKSSKPITYFELNNYDIDWFEEKFGCNIDDATISPKESENGYRWFDIVSSKIDFADFLGLIVILLCYFNSRLINKMK